MVYRVTLLRGWREEGTFYPSGVCALWVTTSSYLHAAKIAMVMGTVLVHRRAVVECEDEGMDLQVARVRQVSRALTMEETRRLRRVMGAYRSHCYQQAVETMERAADARAVRAAKAGGTTTRAAVERPSTTPSHAYRRPRVSTDEPCYGYMVQLWNSKPWHVGTGTAWRVHRGVPSYCAERYGRRYRWDGGGRDRQLLWRDADYAEDRGAPRYDDSPYAYGVEWKE